MEKREKEIRNLLSNSETFYQLKKELDKYYNTIDNKQDFLEWFEFSFLEIGILKIKSDIEQYKGKHSGLDYFGKSQLQRYENCLNWIENIIKTKKLGKESKAIDLNTTKGTDKIKFNLLQTEVIELVKSLIQNGNVKGKQKDIIKIFSQFFEVEIKNQDKIIQDIKNRNNDSETLFLDKLKTSLLDYIKK